MGISAQWMGDHGCCGMAGAFGFESSKYDVSIACAERGLLPAVREATNDCLVIADGFSCREQIAQGSQRRPLHLAEVIMLAHERATLPSDVTAEETWERTLEVDRPPRLAPAAALAVGVIAVGAVGLVAAARSWLEA